MLNICFIYIYHASDVEYINESGSSTDVQDAIDKLYEHFNKISSLKLNIKTYDDELPSTAKNNDIVIKPLATYNNRYFFSKDAPNDPEEGMIWIKFNHDNSVTYDIENSKLPLGICYQYVDGEWNQIKAYIYHNEWMLFSDGFNNWKMLLSLGGVNYSNYNDINTFLNNSEDVNKVINSNQAFNYLYNSSELIKNIKTQENYDKYFVQAVLDNNTLTNKQKYSYRLPFYIFNKTSEFTILTHGGCDINSPGISGMNYNIGDEWSYNFLGSTNCCGGQVIYTQETFDYTDYIKVGATVSSLTLTYTSAGIAIGIYPGGNRISSFLNFNSAGTKTADISGRNEIKNIAAGTFTCNNDNNSPTGLSINGKVSKIYME